MQNKETITIRSFTGLHAWQKAHRFVLLIYTMTKEFPKEELFGLTSQLRRAAVSISSNIAEGFSRFSMKEKAHFYSIALGSLTEVQNQLLIARDVGYLSSEEFNSLSLLSVDVSKLIHGLIKSLDRIRNT